MTNYEPRLIIGAWTKGYALDLHTLSSQAIGYNEFGHLQFENKYSEVGGLLYLLKSKSNAESIPLIAAAAVSFLNKWKPNVDLIVPVPPTKARRLPPVISVATEISKITNLPVLDCVTKTRACPELKSVQGLDERLQLLDGLHAVKSGIVAGKRVLLFDDLYRSGATMNAITAELLKNGGASAVYALTITKTRSNH